MSDAAVTVDRVWKKFRRGELHDSLRDAIPAFARRLVRGRPATETLGAREFWALQDVSFELKRGEALGIIGPNGAGKSTLLKTLSRIIRPTLGEYRINGRLRALIEVAAGFHGDLTGRENIFLNGTILGMSRGEIARKLDQIIDFSGIESFIDTPVKRYSSGMAARLGFSVAAHLDPEILLVDEVLAVGDMVFRAKCLDHMQKLLNSDVSVIFISHNLEQVTRLCDRCVVLKSGQVCYEGDTKRALDVYRSSLENDSQAGFTNSQRAGQGAIRVTTIAVLGPTADFPNVLVTGKPAVIRFNLDQTAQHLICRMAIVNGSGEYIAHFDSARRAPYDEEHCGQPANYFEWRCEELPLLPGKYHLNYSVSTPDGIDQDRRTFAADLDVHGDWWKERLVEAPPGFGSVTFPHQWVRSSPVRNNA